MKRLLIFFVICTSFISYNCSKSAPAENTETVKEPELPGKVVYVKSCRLCHGNDGTLGLSGAANLKITMLNVEQIKTVIMEGRKGMPSWKNQLTPAEIQQVAEYVLTLKNK